MKNQISEAVKEERRDEIMALQQEISLEKSSQLIGKSPFLYGGRKDDR